MPTDGFKHKLAAILSADVVGYSRLITDDEVSTVRTLNFFRDRMTILAGEFEGRIVDFVGDNMLAEFPSALDAARYAIRAQQWLARHNAKLPPERRMVFRFGLNLGDVMIDEERIYGDGVNLAARIQALAEPGSICVSDGFYEQIRGKLDLQFDDLGRKNLKNFPEPVHVLRLIENKENSPTAALVEKYTKRPALLPPAKPSVTVLPFVDLGAGNRSDWLCGGLTMDIMAGLVQIPQLILISAVSIGNTNLKHLSVKEIGEQFGVNHLLDGGIHRIGEKVRITVRLVDTANARQVWAKRFDCGLDDIFAVQDQITSEILIALDVHLVSGKVGRILRQALTDPDAVESYFRGWGALFRSSRADIYLAQEMGEETIRLAPDSPLGYTLAAFSHWWAVVQDTADDAGLALNRAIELAHHAMRMKDVTGLPDLVMAQIHLLKQEHDQALSASERSLNIRPSCHASYAVKANVLNHIGRFAEAIELAEYAIRLSPVFPPFYSTVLASALFGEGRYEEAIATAEVSLAIDPRNLDALLLVAGANAALSRMNDARLATKRILSLKPRFSVDAYFEPQPYRHPRDVEERSSLLRKAGLTD